MAGATFRNTLSTTIHAYAVFGESEDISAEPLGFVLSDLMEDVGVHHGGFGEETAASGWRGEVLQITVEEEAEKGFGDPGQHGFLTEDVEGKDRVDQGVARDDPFLGAG